MLLLILQLISVGPVTRCDLQAIPTEAAVTLQGCIDRAAPGATIGVVPGIYLLDRQVVINKPLTLRTADVTSAFAVCRSNESACATFAAAPTFNDDNGFLYLFTTSDVTLAHVVLHGNRGARLESRAARACEGGNNRGGFNASALDCLRCTLFDVVSADALCGTGFEWTGGRAAIRHSTFRDNGDASIQRMWADGLTALYAPESVITDNLFVDNSDVGVIVGHGPRSFIARNRIVQQRQHAFAGLMLDNFNSSDLRTRGDFRGAAITANSIECGRYGCGFGIQLGPHPWYDSPNIVGGEVTGNVVSGAGIGINVDGAGTRAAPVTLLGNTVLRVDEPTPFPLCGRTETTSSALDIAPDAVVDRRGDVTLPARRRDWHDCG